MSLRVGNAAKTCTPIEERPGSSGFEPARLIAVAALGIGLVLFIPLGPSGAAWAVAMAGFVSYVAMGVMAWCTLQKIKREEIVPVQEDGGSTEA